MSGPNPNAVISALTEDHVSRITGLSKGQLRAWDRRGFFVPQFAYDDRSSAYSRIYSFKDVVGLRTIAILRYKYHLSLSKLESVARELETRGFAHWADTKLHVVKKAVHFQAPGTEDVESLHDRQLAMLPVIDVINDVREKVARLKQRDLSSVGKVERHKFVARNSWVISGTRIPTATIRRYADAGFSVEQILREYPTLTADDVKAALDHEKGLAKSA